MALETVEMPYEREGQTTAFSLEFESALVKNTSIIVKSWRLIIYNKMFFFPKNGCQAVAGVINCHLMSNNHFLVKLPAPSGGSHLHIYTLSHMASAEMGPL